MKAATRTVISPSLSARNGVHLGPERRPLAVGKPQTRADCVDGPRPCPWVACRHHLGLSVSKVGTVHQVHGRRESCSLDIAARGPATLEVCGSALAVTRARAHQVLNDGLAALRATLADKLTPEEARHLDVLLETGGV